MKYFGLFLLLYSAFTFSSSKKLYIDELEELSKFPTNLFLKQFTDFEFSGKQLSYLKKTKSFKKIIQFVEKNLKERKKIIDKELINNYSELPIRFLSSKNHFFNLIGIVLRPDKSLNKNDCGEVRFIYRLSDLKGEKFPFTVMSTYKEKNPDCMLFWKTWKKNLNSKKYQSKPYQFEFNILTHRVATFEKRKLAGHSEYLQFVFDPYEEEFRPLENSIDVKRVLANKALQNKLKVWINNNKVKIKSGFHQVPPIFLANKALSIAPKGYLRLKNFSFKYLNEKLNWKINKNLIARLDEQTCQGCHQVRGLSGFHFLGNDKKDQAFYDSLFINKSLLFESNQIYRHDFIKNFNKGFLSRPKNQTSYLNAGDNGSLCKSDADCINENKCQKYFNNAEMGECLKEEKSGSSCEEGKLVTSFEFYLNDTVRDYKKSRCSSGYTCMTGEIGFPSGYCMSQCEKDCHPAPQTNLIQHCLDVEKLGFEKCLLKSSKLVSLKKCSQNDHCRSDYFCGKRRLGESSGVCLPVYFFKQFNYTFK